MIKKLVLILIFLVLHSYCSAATITRYVNTASEGGDGTTNNTTGTNAAYASLFDWEAAEATDLDAANNSMVVWCSGTDADTTAVVIDGFTTSVDDTITINGDNQSGVYSTDHYRLEVTGDTITVVDYFITFNNMQVKTTGVNNTDRSGIYFQLINGSFITNSVLVYIHPTAQVRGQCIRVVDNSGTTGSLGIINTVIYSDAAGRSRGIWIDSVTNDTINVSNTNISNFGTGIILDNTGIEEEISITNSAIFNNTDDVDSSFTGTLSITYSAGDDTEFDSGTGNIGWDNTSTDWDANFTDYSSFDFSIKDTDADLYDNGTTPAETTDITGYTWDTDDIGAFAYQISATNTQGLLLVW